MNAHATRKAAMLAVLTFAAAAVLLLAGCAPFPPPIPDPHIPPAVGNTVTVELGDGNDVDITRRADNVQTRIAVIVNQQDQVNVQHPVNMHTGLPVDPATIPPPNPGNGGFGVQPTTQTVANSTSGAFRIDCDRSHYLYDDSIVYPGQRGHAHLHVFFGNSDSNGDSSVDQIAKSGNSSCRGGTTNRSSYWVPAMLDMRGTNGGKVVDPTQNLVYYKTGKFNVNGSGDGNTPPVVFTPLPPGLRLLAGNPTANALPPSNPAQMRWGCTGPGIGSTGQQFGPTIPNCPVGSYVNLEIFFAQCWDGKNLDSPDHRSHMSYGVAVKNIYGPTGWTHTECPSTHPKVLPHISYNVQWPVKVKDDPLYWRIVTDVNLANPAGWTAHGDWRNGWDVSISDAWLKNCISGNKDCHAHLLGDGRILYNP